MLQVKGILCTPFAHLEERRGTRDQARDYCRKDEGLLGGRVELGEFEQQRGRRTDIEAFRDAIVGGDKDEELFTSHTAAFLRYGGLIQRARYAIHKRARREMRVIVCCGETGAGKSHYAWNYRDGDMSQVFKLFSKKPLWFDGYAGEPVLFIDEWEGDPTCESLKEICDVWPYQGPIKGGSVIAAWEVVIIATNWYKVALEGEWDAAICSRS